MRLSIQLMRFGDSSLDASVGATEGSNLKCLRASVDFTDAGKRIWPIVGGIRHRRAQRFSLAGGRCHSRPTSTFYGGFSFEMANSHSSCRGFVQE